MKPLIVMAALLLHVAVLGQSSFENYSGVFSLGTRNAVSVFNHDEATGLGIGGQVRLQLGKRINSEWYLDYITSKTNLTARNDYHIGWSLMFYGKNNYDYHSIFQPYLIAGHCFDNTEVFERQNRNNRARRLSMATQAGLGTHINITPKFDCSIAGQYMLHFGKEINTQIIGGKPVIQKTGNSHIDGHFLFTISFNYKAGRLWGKG